MSNNPTESLIQKLEALFIKPVMLTDTNPVELSPRNKGYNCGLKSAIEIIRQHEASLHVKETSESLQVQVKCKETSQVMGAPVVPEAKDGFESHALPLQQREICVLDEPEAVQIMEKANQDCPDCKGTPCYWRMYRALKPYFFHPTKPVSIEDGARAMYEYWPRNAEDTWEHLNEGMRKTFLTNAKACAEAWGMKCK